MADFFGNEKTIAPLGSILTGEFCRLSLGGGVALLQQAIATSGRQIQPMFEAGKTTTYYITGNSEGNIQATAAVGQAGFFAGINKSGSNCGQIDSLSFDVTGGGACAVSLGGGGVKFQHGLIESVGIQLGAGATAVTNNFAVRVAEMSAVG
jgi:hypothetical protein